MLVERLERDLLPRTAGGHDHLVVGLVGPNNSGKSALFNALSHGVEERGARAPSSYSPSRATGGATRRLVGAAHPVLRAALEGEPTLERFRFQRATLGPSGVEEATRATDAPDELLLVETEALPESLLLVDTPDFDSVLVDNRAVTDALLTVVDVAVVVVTRHTYQNREVVDFLRAWLVHGRPWILVYNEAIDEETTARHALKLESDIGTPPEAVFAAPYEKRIAAGEEALVPLEIGGDGAALSRWLRALGDAGSLKERALTASLDALARDAAELGVQLREETARASAVLELVQSRSKSLAESVAREAMPMGPFLLAFRDVLDERPTAVQRELRRGIKWTSRTIEGSARWVGRQVLGRGTPAKVKSPDETLLDAEKRELRARFGDSFESTVAALRELHRGGRLPNSVALVLGSRFTGPGAVTASDALAGSIDAIEVRPELFEEYHAACRTLIASELDGGVQSEWLLQIGVDVLHLLPLGVAGAVIVQTGGLGADLAVLGGGALSAAAAERLSRTLGASVVKSARSRWIELRTGALANAVALGILGTEIERATNDATERATAIQTALGAYRATT